MDTLATGMLREGSPKSLPNLQELSPIIADRGGASRWNTRRHGPLENGRSQVRSASFPFISINNSRLIRRCSPPASEPPCTSIFLPLPPSNPRSKAFLKNGHQLRSGCDPGRRLAHNDGRLHREPGHGQADASARHDLVLPLRLRR